MKNGDEPWLSVTYIEIEYNDLMGYAWDMNGI